MSEFAVIPVIDLKGGVAVHAKGGKRADYRPLETPFGPADDPLAIARGLLDVTGSTALYIADLDAIEGRGNNYSLCRDLADVLPTTTLWIDAGFSDVDECAFWLPLGATLVIGSESLASHDNWKDIHAKSWRWRHAVTRLRRCDDAWTADIARRDRAVARTAHRHESRPRRHRGGARPRPAEVRLCQGRRARRVYAAGGIRNSGDLAKVTETGARGALIATALHTGAVTQKEIAALSMRAAILSWR